MATSNAVQLSSHAMNVLKSAYGPHGYSGGVRLGCGRIWESGKGLLEIIHLAGESRSPRSRFSVLSLLSRQKSLALCARYLQQGRHMDVSQQAYLHRHLVGHMEKVVTSTP